MIGTTVTGKHLSLGRGCRYRSTNDSGNAAFNPASLTGLVLWLDATTISGLGDGSGLATWSDVSGNSKDATQATSGKRPLYKTAIQNGKPIVRFDGVDDEMQGTNPVSTGPMTVFAAANLRSQSGNIGILFETTSGSNDAFYTYREVASGVMRMGNSASGGAQFDGPTQSLNAFHVFSFLANAASSLVAIDGVVTNGSIGSQTLTATLYVLCHWISGGQFHPWDIGEVLLYNSALSSTDRRKIEAYLGSKWGVTVS